MKFRFRYAVLPCLLPAFAAACSTEATHRRPNIFDDEESFAAVTFSSNADSLFLSWELTDDRIQFDSYRITDNKSQQVLTVGRDEHLVPADARAVQRTRSNLPVARRPAARW